MSHASTLESQSIAGLPAELVDILMRESALDLAYQKLDEARAEVIAQKARLEMKPGLLNSFSGKASQERELNLKTAVAHKLHYDAQIKKAESLSALLGKETGRWLEWPYCYVSPDFG